MEWFELPAFSNPSPFLDLHPLVSQALIRRGITNPTAARAFLDPLEFSPSLASEIPGLTQVVSRLCQAITKKEAICIWGDFDVDGQTSTSILFETLRDLGADVFYHIPVRENEGHGVNIPILEQMINNGARLVLTCDTGITALDAVDYARSRGVDMAITDHHALPDILPNACALTNPRFLPESHSLGSLSGSGLAYKLAEELYGQFNHFEMVEKHLDLAALGLVADVAVLKGDARYIVQRGLESLRACSRLGLQVIFEAADLSPIHLTEEHIGFVIGPRLNALGRLGDANPAVDLFTTSDPARARLLATQLEALNFQRQLLCSQVTQAAEMQLQQDPSLASGPVIILNHAGWPGGIIGIVASRLVERYHKPVLLFTISSDGIARGSARSVEGVDITSAISAQKDLLLGFGGHPMAAGLSLNSINLPAFRSRISSVVEKSLENHPNESRLQIDGWLTLQEISLGLAEALGILAPFGSGNEKLVLASHDLRLESSAVIGRNKEHLKLNVVDPGGKSQIVFWWNGAGEKLPEGRFDLAFTISAVDWRGVRQAQAEFVDYRSFKENDLKINTFGKEVVDYRQSGDSLNLLDEIRKFPSTLVWAEGPEKKKVGGVDRNELVPAENLVIWSLPPSASELHQAIDKVSPRRVYLFGIGSSIQTENEFKKYLFGLISFILNKRAGKTSLAELAALTGQRESAVQRALDWFACEGLITVLCNDEASLEISSVESEKDPLHATRLKQELVNILEETSAYRAYFLTADKDTLVK